MHVTRFSNITVKFVVTCEKSHRSNVKIKIARLKSQLSLEGRKVMYRTELYSAGAQKFKKGRTERKVR